MVTNNGLNGIVSIKKKSFCLIFLKTQLLVHEGNKVGVRVLRCCVVGGGRGEWEKMAKNAL